MKKKSSERGAGSDGNYMTKQNLWLAHRVSEMLYKGIPDGMLLPDWAESKINSAAQHLKEVAGWAMHESHGDELHHGPEANPIHLGDQALRSRLAAEWEGYDPYPGIFDDSPSIELGPDEQTQENFEIYQESLKSFLDLSPGDDRITRHYLQGWSPTAQEIRKFQNASGWVEQHDALEDPIYSFGRSPKDVELKQRLQSDPGGRKFWMRIQRDGLQTLFERWFHANGYKMKVFDISQE
jgi:hypothetical protein